MKGVLATYTIRIVAPRAEMSNEEMEAALKAAEHMMRDLPHLAALYYSHSLDGFTFEVES